MTGMDSDPIQQRVIARQTTEPGRVTDGFLWINPAGGASGNNSERYVWNADAAAWELDKSVGPDSPNYAVSGSLWRDTANSKQKVYDGAAWSNIGVTDHANLSNVTANQHRHMEAKRTSGSSVVETVSWTTAFGTSPVISTSVHVSNTNGATANVESRSTTSADIRSTSGGTGQSYAKMAVATEGT